MIASLLLRLKGIGIGKSEFGIAVHVIMLVAWLLPVLPEFTWEVMVQFQTVWALFTGSAFLSRIESQQTALKALKSIFGGWGQGNMQSQIWGKVREFVQDKYEQDKDGQR